MMVWNEDEEYKIGLFYRVVWKDVELSRNFLSMWVLNIKKYMTHKCYKIKNLQIEWPQVFSK